MICLLKRVRFPVRYVKPPIWEKSAGRSGTKSRAAGADQISKEIGVTALRISPDCWRVEDPREEWEKGSRWSRWAAVMVKLFWRLFCSTCLGHIDLEVSWNGGILNHPFYFRIFHEINQLFWWSSNFFETPISRKKTSPSRFDSGPGQDSIWNAVPLLVAIGYAT